MNFHFARLARRRGIPALQYVAPQLWAWAPWRMKKLRDCVDQVACILPFEESYFLAHGVNATFVGHPLFDELPEGRMCDRPAFSNGRPPVIGLLPGSRKAEAQHNFPPAQSRVPAPGPHSIHPPRRKLQPGDDTSKHGGHTSMPLNRHPRFS